MLFLKAGGSLDKNVEKENPLSNLGQQAIEKLTPWSTCF